MKRLLHALPVRLRKRRSFVSSARWGVWPALAALLAGGCDETIHQYPRSARVELEVVLDLDLSDPQPYRTVTYSADAGRVVTQASPAGISAQGRSAAQALEGRCDLRYRIDIYPADEAGTPGASPCASYRATAPVGEGCERHAARFTLPEGSYAVLAWADYVPCGTEEDVHYRTADLRNVRLADHHSGNDDTKDAYTGVQAVVLRASGYRSGVCRVSKEVPLRRPFAKFHVVATDLQEYLNAGGDAGLHAALSYALWLPAAYDVAEQRVVSYAQNRSFVAPAYATGESEVILACDYVFAGAEESSVMIVTEARDARGNPVNRIPAIEIPLLGNGLTEVRGALLTADFGSAGGGMEIDDGFDDEIVIEIPD